VIVKRHVYVMLSTGSVCLFVARDNEALVVCESEVVVALFIRRRLGYIKTVKNGR